MRIPRVMRRSSLYRLLVAGAILLGTFHGVQAEDAFVVISGGGSPASNHYSQYLQARAYVTYLRAHYPHGSIWTFFGAGNQSGHAPVLFDVEQSSKDAKGRDSTTWIAGALPDNRPARHDEIARALQEEILPTVKNGGTLYLFVGDHGGPSSDSRGESIISLWGWDRDPTVPYGWRSYSDSETLGVAELRRWLSAGLGRGKVVFVMSQCFSGGFHYLGLPRGEMPDPAWFARPPAWAHAVPQPKDLPLVAGFTATDDQSFASGCTSDVSADKWAGYERYLPENLTGIDLFTLKPGTLPAQPSFYDAHVQAVQADQTIDKPRATSEQYLADWARTLERMEQEPAVIATIKPALAHFRQVLDGAAPQVTDAALQARADEFHRYTEHMIQTNPELKGLVQAPQARLESMIRAAQARSSGGRSPRYAPDGMNEENGDQMLYVRLWNKAIEPAWQHALQANELNQLPAPVLAYEHDLAQLRASAEAAAEDGDEPSAGPAASLDPELLPYYEGGYADPASFDPARAKAVADWENRRYRAILDWAKKSKDEKLRGAANAVLALVPAHLFDPDAADDTPDGPAAAPNKHRLPQPPRPTPDIAAARILLYRQVLASWQFLLETGEKPALERLAAITRLERSPLPAAKH